MTQAAGVCAAGEEAVPAKKTKTVVSTSEIRTSKARVQKVRKFPQRFCSQLPVGGEPPWALWSNENHSNNHKPDVNEITMHSGTRKQ